MKKGWCHVPIPLTQGPVPLMNGCPTFCVVQERVPKDRSQKHMCRFKSSGNWIGRSPWVHLWVKLNDGDLHCRSPSLSVMSYHSPNLFKKEEIKINRHPT
jgi:hypothetical protein